jgi:simple sugar transport system ATP-binding protein
MSAPGTGGGARAPGAGAGEPTAGAGARLVLELSGVTRAFGAVVANRAVDLRVAPATVHALVGENGAGKSTALKIAYGEIAPDVGEVRVRGRTVRRHSPRAAIAAGIGMVHQHFMLIESMTVVENVVLGNEPLRRGLVDFARASRELAALSERHGLALDPGARVADLSVGERQRVEILKLLWRGGEILLLDEPTAVLTPGEVRALFAVLRGLVAAGKTVVLVGHKLDEVCALADRITVMRQGAVVGELGRAEASPEAIAHLMVGHPVLFAVERPPARPGEVVLDLAGLRVARARGDDAVRGIDLGVRAGEIVGMAGVEGNGQRELVEAVVGLRRARAGRIAIAGHEVTRAPVAARHAAGLAHVPADRHARGLVLDLGVAENLLLGRQRELGFFLRPGVVLARARAAIASADLRPPDPLARARALSGGNQQKLVVARELDRPGARVLVAVQPTRGVDVGALEHIHRALIAARDRGLGVLLVSTDLDELLALADRLLVNHRGRIVAALAGAPGTGPGRADVAAALREELGELMTGARGGAPEAGGA